MMENVTELPAKESAGMTAFPNHGYVQPRCDLGRRRQ
jgi:hypothetical protein